MLNQASCLNKANGIFSPEESRCFDNDKLETSVIAIGTLDKHTYTHTRNTYILWKKAPVRILICKTQNDIRRNKPKNCHL